ncbi:unnamed protein product [Arctogadus glacialis]
MCHYLELPALSSPRIAFLTPPLRSPRKKLQECCTVVQASPPPSLLPSSPGPRGRAPGQGVGEGVGDAFYVLKGLPERIPGGESNGRCITEHDVKAAALCLNTSNAIPLRLTGVAASPN